MQVLRQLPKVLDKRLLVGLDTADDAGVYRLDRDRALVQTVDFFTPIVDDPFMYGQIAAANALSDVYAMGGRPITAMNLMGIPTETVPPSVIRSILHGGASKLKEAGCVLVGGHTIRNPEPIYGLSVTGLVSPSRILTNAAARPGDLLLLTKPLGTGIITTGIKRGLASAATAKQAIRSMGRLNSAGAELGEKGLVRACTDVTGYGLLGHLGSMCRASAVGAVIMAGQLPCIGREVFELIAGGCIPGGSRENLNTANSFVEWGETGEPQKALLTDAQTSGGLLLCVSQRHLDKVLKVLKACHTPCAAVIGRICTFGQTERLDSKMKRSLRSIPAVEKVLQALGDVGLPRPTVVAVVRRGLASCRAHEEIPDFGHLLAHLQAELKTLRDSRIRPVINGTGILIHTNLGRAPIAAAALETLCSIGANYSNLEYDVSGGERGARAAYLEHNLALLCGSGAATVVNNCAAALVLILRHFTAKRSEVILSRGELVQIGGGFRIPEILESSGARLREVGTTNKTSLADYAKAITRDTAMILKVHRSNFFMGGFVEAPLTEQLAALARKKRVPFIEDLGSGAVLATDKVPGVEHEPTPAEVLRCGVDLVCFSGDKLLGGPQAGIIAGKAKWIAALKREPFFRALRCDKLILSALQSTVDLYLGGSPPGKGNESQQKAWASVPVLEMLATPQAELRVRVEKMMAGLSGLPLQATLGSGRGEMGGGTLPRSNVPSVVLKVTPNGLTLPQLATRLREWGTPIIGYISGGCLKLDVRTIFPRQDEEVVRGIRAAFANPPAQG